MRCARRAALGVLFAAWLAPGALARAHPLAPLALWVQEDAEGVELQLKRSRVMPPGAAFAPRLPERCRPLEARVRAEPTFVVEEQRLRCEGSLVGARFGVDGLSEAGVDAVVRVQLRDGRVLRALLAETRDSFVVPARMSTVALAGSFARSGLQHLLAGLDHVLLVVGLVLLLGAPGRVLWALTAFTLGHGLSMCGAVMGWIVLPTALAEAAIAATLVWLAWEIARRRADSTSLERPYAAALGVGLVHGLGFAAVFSDVGLAGGDLALGLGAFHLGIEVGQLAIVLATLLLLRLAQGRRALLEPLAAYGIGAVATMWLIERVLVL